MPSNIDLAWTAGFLEGEGSFLPTVVKPGLPRYYRGHKITAIQKQRQPIDRLWNLFGGKVSEVRRSTGIYWLWILTGPRAVCLAMTLFSFMSPRRKGQIRALLDRWRTLPGRGRPRVDLLSKTTCPAGHPYDIFRTSPRKHRECSLCRREASRRGQQRRRAKLAIVGN